MAPGAHSACGGWHAHGRPCLLPMGGGRGRHHEQHVSRPDQNFGRGHALLLSARHAAQHGVAHHCVGAPGQPQQLDDQLHPAAAPSSSGMRPVFCPNKEALNHSRL